MTDASGHAESEDTGPDTGPERTLSEVAPDPEDPLAVVEESPWVSLETVFEVVAHPGRRYVLTYLQVADGPVSTAELVDYVLRNTAMKGDEERLRRQIAAELVDEQLPELEDVAFIDYNRERQLVAGTARGRLTLPFLQLGRQYVARQSGESDD